MIFDILLLRFRMAFLSSCIMFYGLDLPMVSIHITR